MLRPHAMVQLRSSIAFRRIDRRCVKNARHHKGLEKPARCGPVGCSSGSGGVSCSTHALDVPVFGSASGGTLLSERAASQGSDSAALVSGSSAALGGAGTRRGRRRLPFLVSCALQFGADPPCPRLRRGVFLAHRGNGQAARRIGQQGEDEGGDDCVEIRGRDPERPYGLRTPHRGEIGPGRTGRAEPFGDSPDERKRSRRQGAEPVQPAPVGRIPVVGRPRAWNAPGEFAEHVSPDRQDTHRADLAHGHELGGRGARERSHIRKAGLAEPGSERGGQQAPPEAAGREAVDRLIGQAVEERQACAGLAEEGLRKRHHGSRKGSYPSARDRQGQSNLAPLCRPSRQQPAAVMLPPERASDPLPPEAAAWRNAFGALRPGSSPCRYLGATAWANIHEACTDFIERYGAEAVRLGWTAPQLFGVHPEHGTLRVDWCGVLMIGGRKATHIEAGRILFDNTSGYRDLPGLPVGMPIWEFAARR